MGFSDLTGRRAASPAEHELLGAVKRRLNEIDDLEQWLARVEEDGVYRYYHQSLKVYGMQAAITRAKDLFEELAPEGTKLNAAFAEICREACAHRFTPARSNQQWHAETRPILEGFWHCSYFVRMLARCGRELEEPPNVLPFGWAAVLYLYGLR